MVTSGAYLGSTPKPTRARRTGPMKWIRQPHESSTTSSQKDLRFGLIRDQTQQHQHASTCDNERAIIQCRRSECNQVDPGSRIIIRLVVTERSYVCVRVYQISRCQRAPSSHLLRWQSQNHGSCPSTVRPRRSPKCPCSLQFVPQLAQRFEIGTRAVRICKIRRQGHQPDQPQPLTVAHRQPTIPVIPPAQCRFWFARHQDRFESAPAVLLFPRLRKDAPVVAANSTESSE